MDTANNAHSRGTRNGGHGHVYVYGTRACPCGSWEANAVAQPISRSTRPGPEWIRAFLLAWRRFPDGLLRRKHYQQTETEGVHHV